MTKNLKDWKIPAAEEPQWITEWREDVIAERRRQVELGYDNDHDEKHGVIHLLMWAQRYLSVGETIKAAALIQAAREIA